MIAITYLLAAIVPCLPPDGARVAEIARHLPETPLWSDEAFPVLERESGTLMEEPIPDCSDDLYLLTTTTGNRERYEKVYHRRVEMLRAFAGTARAANGDGCLKRTIELLEAICDERSWTLPAHDMKLTNFRGSHLTIDLGSANRAHALAGTLAQLGDRIPSGVRAKVRAELERRVFALYRATNRDSGDPKALAEHGNWWFFTRSNWSAVCHSRVVRAALAVLEDRMDRAAFVEAGERGMRFFLESFLPDGYCTEGIGYWNYGYGHFLEFTMAARKATGGFVDFAALPRAKEAMGYAFGYTLDGVNCPVFADGGSGRAEARFLDIGCAIWPEFAAVRKKDLPPRTFFPDAQVYIGRSRRIAFAVKGGTNDELHNHNDIGSWTLCLDGQEVAGDPGKEIYTARTFSKNRYDSAVLNSFGHPVPRVGGELQLTGSESRAEILLRKFSETRDIFSIDLSSAYPATRGQKGAVARAMVFDREKESVTIVDRLRVEKPIAFESAVISYGETCPLVPKATGGAWHVGETVLENPGRPSPRRFAVVFDEPVVQADVTWTFCASCYNGFSSARRSEEGTN